MEKVRKMLVYLIVIAFAFYLLPFFIKNTGSGMLVLLLAIPMTCFISSLIYGMKHSFNWSFPMLVALLFIPTLFIFYNESASIYSLIYGVISVLGSFLGSLLYKKKKV
ncbi:hypothetical protein [Facklamia sp. P12955]|uniref:hypothetical protein n=1 Tax=Facklamia sp. P12955 TaxID=3421946 RepID=UPI003D16DA36